MIRSYNFVSRWLFSTNHKDISTLYLICVCLLGVIGAVMSMLIVLELLSNSFFIGFDIDMLGLFLIVVYVGSVGVSFLFECFTGLNIILLVVSYFNLNLLCLIDFVLNSELSGLSLFSLGIFDFMLGGFLLVAGIVGGVRLVLHDVRLRCMLDSLKLIIGCIIYLVLVSLGYDLYELICNAFIDGIAFGMVTGSGKKRKRGSKGRKSILKKEPLKANLRAARREIRKESQGFYITPQGAYEEIKVSWEPSNVKRSGLVADNRDKLVEFERATGVAFGKESTSVDNVYEALCNFKVNDKHVIAAKELDEVAREFSTREDVIGILNPHKEFLNDRDIVDILVSYIDHFGKFNVGNGGLESITLSVPTSERFFLFLLCFFEEVGEWNGSIFITRDADIDDLRYTISITYSNGLGKLIKRFESDGLLGYRFSLDTLVYLDNKGWLTETSKICNLSESRLYGILIVTMDIEQYLNEFCLLFSLGVVNSFNFGDSDLEDRYKEIYGVLEGYIGIECELVDNFLGGSVPFGLRIFGGVGFNLFYNKWHKHIMGDKRYMLMSVHNFYSMVDKIEREDPSIMFGSKMSNMRITVEDAWKTAAESVERVRFESYRLPRGLRMQMIKERLMNDFCFFPVDWTGESLTSRFYILIKGANLEFVRDWTVLDEQDATRGGALSKSAEADIRKTIKAHERFLRNENNNGPDYKEIARAERFLAMSYADAFAEAAENDLKVELEKRAGEWEEEKEEMEKKYGYLSQEERDRLPKEPKTRDISRDMKDWRLFVTEVFENASKDPDYYKPGVEYTGNLEELRRSLTRLPKYEVGYLSPTSRTRIPDSSHKLIETDEKKSGTK